VVGRKPWIWLAVSSGRAVVLLDFSMNPPGKEVVVVPPVVVPPVVVEPDVVPVVPEVVPVVVPEVVPEEVVPEEVVVGEPLVEVEPVEEVLPVVRPTWPCRWSRRSRGCSCCRKEGQESRLRQR
jgi:hypothetical protein